MLANTAVGFLDAGQGVASGIGDKVMLANTNLFLKTLISYLPPGLLRDELQATLTDFMKSQIEASAATNAAIKQLQTVKS